MTIFQEILKPLNLIFIALIAVLSINSFRKIKREPNEVTTLPNTIATLGIIGTFVGIVLGLLKFNTSNIEESIPLLLNGMKTAFITSIIGLIASTILKSIQSSEMKKRVKNEKNNFEETSIERAILQISELKDEIKIGNSELIKTLKEIEISNIKNNRIMIEELRSNSLDIQKSLNQNLIFLEEKIEKIIELGDETKREIEKGNKILIDEFRVFAKNMAENNMKAFTEAIQECVKDLNNQLQEQFGENFKHLNQAVIKLLEWQEHYKDTIEKTNENQVRIYKGMLQSKEVIEDITKKIHTIVEVANRLGDKIHTFDLQEKSLTNSIELMNKVSNEAKVLIPNLDRYISEFKKKIISVTEETKIYFNNFTETIKKQQNEVINSLKEVTEKMKLSSEINIKNIEEQIQSMDKAFVKFENEGFTLTKKISDNIQVMVENNNNNLENSVKNLNSSLEKTLNMSLQSLGEQLASVSEKFVSDYTPLTIELQKLVNLAKKVGK